MGSEVSIRDRSFAELEMAQCGTGILLRCPNCLYGNPGGMTFCFDCGVAFCILEEESFTAMLVICIPENVVDLEIKARKMSRTSLFGFLLSQSDAAAE